MNSLSASLFFLFSLPLAGALGLFFVGRQDSLRKNLNLVIFLLSLCASIYLLFKPEVSWSRHFGGYTLTLGLNKVSRLILILSNLLSALICLYSKDYICPRRSYYPLLLLLLAFGNLQILATDFVLFSFSWVGSIFILYALLKPGSRFSAKKAVTILGFCCLCFMLGAYIYYRFSGSTSMSAGMTMVLNKPICWLAFGLMLIGALGKIDAWPFHTWVPLASESAPVTVMAILPASLDKLIGVYLLARICLDLFILNGFVVALLLMIGSLTIVIAALLAHTQQDLRKMLSYYTISQAGYMIIGIGTANPVGIVGAIFHMFNNAIYKNGLFLIAGAVEKEKGSFDFAKLGDLGRYMPLTFVSGLILALSISGIPPFSGFASKWMIYQGAFLGLTSSAHLGLRFIYLFSLLAVMFGSAFTLVSFLKFIQAIFLGQDNQASKKKIGEASWKMLTSLFILAGLCLILGVFSNYFIKHLLAPSFPFVLDYSGVWNSLGVGLFFTVALVLGFVLWRITSAAGRVREDGFFVGGS